MSFHFFILLNHFIYLFYDTLSFIYFTKPFHLLMFYKLFHLLTSPSPFVYLLHQTLSFTYFTKLFYLQYWYFFYYSISIIYFIKPFHLLFYYALQSYAEDANCSVLIDIMFFMLCYSTLHKLYC